MVSCAPVRELEMHSNREYTVSRSPFGITRITADRSYGRILAGTLPDRGRILARSRPDVAATSRSHRGQISVASRVDL